MVSANSRVIIWHNPTLSLNNPSPIDFSGPACKQQISLPGYSLVQ